MGINSSRRVFQDTHAHIGSSVPLHWRQYSTAPARATIRAHDGHGESPRSKRPRVLPPETDHASVTSSHTEDEVEQLPLLTCATKAYGLFPSNVVSLSAVDAFAAEIAAYICTAERVGQLLEFKERLPDLTERERRGNIVASEAWVRTHWEEVRLFIATAAKRFKGSLAPDPIYATQARHLDLA